VGKKVVRVIAFTAELHQYFGMETLGSYVRSHEIVEVDGILADVDALFRRRYACDCATCLRRAADGRLVGDCCQGAEIRVSESERRNILAHLGGILPYMDPAPRHALEERLAHERHDPTLAFCHPVHVRGRRTDLYALRWQPDTHCIFRFIAQGPGRPHVYCAIHSYLLDHGLPLWGVKPLTCLVWPLALVPLCDGHLLITVHSLDTFMFTSEGRFHVSRPCLASPPPDAPFVYQTCEPDLRHLLGDAFYEHLLTAVRSGTGRWVPTWGQPELWPAASVPLREVGLGPGQVDGRALGWPLSGYPLPLPKEVGTR